jgi:hypothetical protein
MHQSKHDYVLNGRGGNNVNHDKFALAVAIVLSSVAAGGAAPKRQNVYRSSPRAQATVPRAAPFSNPDSPEATGGGSLGYNQRIYNW